MAAKKSTTSRILALATTSSALVLCGWVSIPATPDASDKIVITGGNLTPFSAVTITVVDAKGNRSEQLRDVSPEGEMWAEFLPTDLGTYEVKAFDKDGKQIGGGVVAHFKEGAVSR